MTTSVFFPLVRLEDATTLEFILSSTCLLNNAIFDFVGLINLHVGIVIEVRFVVFHRDECVFLR